MMTWWKRKRNLKTANWDWDVGQVCRAPWREAQGTRKQSRHQHSAREHGQGTCCTMDAAGVCQCQWFANALRPHSASLLGTWPECTRTTLPCSLIGYCKPVTSMFSTVIRRATPSLRQARSYTAAAHTQAAASSSSKLDKGEQAIHDKLSEHFQTSELLVQDVSGAHHSHSFRIIRKTFSRG